MQVSMKLNLKLHLFDSLLLEHYSGIQLNRISQEVASIARDELCESGRRISSTLDA
jgi:hypothetical protein